MQQRSLPLSSKRRYLCAILATGLACGSASQSDAQEVRLIAPSQAKLVAPQPDASQPPSANTSTAGTTAADAPAARIATAPSSDADHGGEMMLNAPGNSTLEMRLARRPWLLEKLMNPGGSDSESADVPKPPADLPDPPSLNRLVPKPVDRSPIDHGDDDGGWRIRQPSAASPLNPAPQQPSLRLVEPQQTAPRAVENTTQQRPILVPAIAAPMPKVTSPEVAAPKVTAPAPAIPATAIPAPAITVPAITAPAPIATQDSGPTTRPAVRPAPVTPAEPKTRLAPTMSPVPTFNPAPKSTPLPPRSDTPIPLTDPPEMGTVNSRPAPSPRVYVAPQEAPTTRPAAPQPSSARPTRIGDSARMDDRLESSSTTTRSVGDIPATEDPSFDIQDDEIPVRKLKIARDGKPVDEDNEGSANGRSHRSIGDLPPYVDTDQSEPQRSTPRTISQAPELSIAPERAAPDRISSLPKPQRPDLDRPDAISQHEVRPELDYAGYPAQPIELSLSVRRLQNTMRACLSYYHDRREVANERSNWGMMHAIMVYGVDTKVQVERNSYSTIAWIAGNNACRGQRLLTEKDGRIVVRSGVGLQGHQAQMLAVFSLCEVPEDYPLYADGQQFSVADVIREEQLACKSGEELTFTLIGLSHYMDTDATWTSEDGQTWDFQRLIREELSQPIVGAACGGTHRLMGFAHALRQRRAEGKPIDGQWQRAEKFTQDFVDYAYRLQNRDGSFSTDWFEGRENKDDIDRKVQVTGHMVEWLLTLTPDSELQNPRLVSAVRYLLSAMYRERGHDWSIGPKGHALRSLAMFYERAYQSGPAWQQPMTARSNDQIRR
ncbi:hypothetical protein K227x_62510 [Rubripirellula lacrimiformis]|uniref:Prenyltransferase and squalene oxidase repeat protein n=1 Tax=Rubripirellula lacrimiformis TaxID=1930273 RepID=A0A517NL04_9BACT|nr:hypothetical protein K227x_62510 [Rubripirellula lacrimiformis]